MLYEILFSYAIDVPVSKIYLFYVRVIFDKSVFWELLGFWVMGNWSVSEDYFLRGYWVGLIPKLFIVTVICVLLRLTEFCILLTISVLSSP